MEEVLERREGGNGHDKAREKVCVTVVRRLRTWRRVRRSFMGAFEPLSGCITAEGKAGSKTPLSDLTPLLIGESSDCGEFELSTF